MDEIDVKEYLIENDQEFRKLAKQHRNYEHQLEELVGKPYLNTQDQLEESVIKKKKLALKDQMQLRIHRHQTQQSA